MRRLLLLAAAAATTLAIATTTASARPLPTNAMPMRPPPLFATNGARLANPSSAARPSLLFPRPPWRKHALMARWLAHEAPYGVLATVAPGGAPVGGVVSVADAALPAPTPSRAARAAGDDPAPPPPPPQPQQRSGRLFLYLSPMDELTQNLAKDARVSLTLTQMSTTTACQTDPEDPQCARASFLGKAIGPLQGDAAAAAKAALFAKHPAMQDWPDDHAFGAWEVVVDEVHLLDYYGGMAVIPAGDYYGAQAPPDEKEEGARASGGGRAAAAMAASSSSPSSASIVRVT